MNDNLQEMERIAAQEADDARLRVTISAAVIEALPDAIVVADQGGKIFLVNREMELMFGYQRKDIIGSPVEILIPDRLGIDHVQHRQNFQQEPRTRYMGAGLQLTAKRRDGSELPVEISLSPVPSERGLFTIVTIRRKRG